MEAVPRRARAYVASTALGALLCLLPLPATRTSWSAVALLAVLYAACEQAAKKRTRTVSHRFRSCMVVGSLSAGGQYRNALEVFQGSASRRRSSRRDSVSPGSRASASLKAAIASRRRP